MMKVIDQIRRSEWLIPTALTVAIGAFSIYLHFQDNTMLAHSDKIWDQRITMHRFYYPFSARLFTTWSVIGISQLFDIGYRLAFTILMYVLYFGLSLTFYAYLRALGFGRIVSNLGLAMLLCAYPMLCAFFEPVFTWDDFWQYLATAAALLLLLKKRYLWAAIVFALGIIAREPTMLFYPAYLYALMGNKGERKLTFWSAALIPVVVFAIYMALTYQPPDPVRYHNINENFKNPDWAKNSVYSLIISFGFLWMTSLAALAANGADIGRNRTHSFIVLGAAYSVPMTIAIVFTTTFARETRLFFPPFVFLIPLTLELLRTHAHAIRQFYTRHWGVWGVILIAASGWFGQWSAKVLFPRFDYRSEQRFSYVFLGIQIALAIALLVPLLVPLCGFAAARDAEATTPTPFDHS